MATFDPEKITFFAKTDARGKERTFGIKAKDRQRHMYVVGKTGMGKSTLLENMAAQDIQSGEGVAFIDPHGAAAETLLDYVPEHRIDDVVYFAPFDLNYPVSFNVMEDVGPDKRHLVVSGLMSTFKKVWVDAWSARMEYILTNALFALIEYPDTTLLSVSRMLADKAYRQKVVDYIKDPAVKSFWADEFANYTDRFAAEALPAIQNKIGQFTLNPLIRNIIGQPHSSFNIREIMDKKKILIMNLSKGLVGDTNANLLGSMLTTRIYLAAMSRADLPMEEMRMQPNFYFYVDEFQSFANATFADILSEARKYHLNLIIAHQYIAQMEEEVRDAVFGNVGTTISFRVGPFDGEVLETVYAPQFTATDLVNLGFAQIYLTLMIDGIGSQPFSATTLPPIQRLVKTHRTQVINRSRSLYADDREKVEKVVDELHAHTVDESNKGKKNKGGKGKGQSDNNKKKDSKPKPVSDGPQTKEELREILAQVAKENGGVENKSAKADDAKKQEEDTATQDKQPEPVSDPKNDDAKATDQQKESTDKDVKNSDKEQNTNTEVERFADVEEYERQQKEREQQKKDNKDQQQNQKQKERPPEKAKKTETSEQHKNNNKHSTEVDNNHQNAERLSNADSAEASAHPESTEGNQSHRSNKSSERTGDQTASQAVERFADVERSQKHSNKKPAGKGGGQKHHTQKTDTNKQELKAALAEVLKEADKKKQTYKVPAFNEAKEAEKPSGPPTVRVVKPETSDTPPPAAPEPKPEPQSAPEAKPPDQDSIDRKVVKQMLQTSKHEKSPLNP